MIFFGKLWKLHILNFFAHNIIINFLGGVFMSENRNNKNNKNYSQKNGNNERKNDNKLDQKKKSSDNTKKENYSSELSTWVRNNIPGLKY